MVNMDSRYKCNATALFRGSQIIPDHAQNGCLLIGVDSLGPLAWFEKIVTVDQRFAPF